jgi:hypothetical protein
MKAKITIQIKPTHFERDQNSPNGTSVYRAKIPLSVSSAPTAEEANQHVATVYRWCLNRFGPDVMNSGYSFHSQIRGVTALFDKETLTLRSDVALPKGCVDVDIMFYDADKEAMFVQAWVSLYGGAQ